MKYLERLGQRVSVIANLVTFASEFFSLTYIKPYRQNVIQGILIHIVLMIFYFK